jgi:hypothetical protein
MVTLFNRDGHTLWSTPFFSAHPSATCTNLNFYQVVREWNVNGTQSRQTAFAILPKAEFLSAASLNPLSLTLSQFVTEQATLNAMANASGSPGVKLSIGADDFHSTIASILDPSRILSPSTLRSFYSGSIVPSGIPFVPYLEALNAMALLTPSLVIGIPAGTTRDHRLWPRSGSTAGDEIGHVFTLRAAVGDPLVIPSTVSRVQIQALMGDSYIDSTSGVIPTVEVAVAAAGTSRWR